ncbi:MAG: MmgE/PrpD family protein, partial [Dehalococcoidia bacterium]
KITIEEDQEFTQRFPAEYNCRIEITTPSGQTLTAETSYPKGHRNNPLDDTEVGAKFTRLASPILSESQCSDALDLLWSLETQPNLDAVLDSLVV